GAPLRAPRRRAGRRRADGDAAAGRRDAGFGDARVLPRDRARGWLADLHPGRADGAGRASPGGADRARARPPLVPQGRVAAHAAARRRGGRGRRRQARRLRRRARRLLPRGAAAWLGWDDAGRGGARGVRRHLAALARRQTRRGRGTLRPLRHAAAALPAADRDRHLPGEGSASPPGHLRDERRARALGEARRARLPGAGRADGVARHPLIYRGTMLSAHDYRALAEFRYQVRRFLHFSEQAARSAGLEPQQHQLLLAVKGLPEDQRPTIGTVAERLQLQHHSADELIDRAEKRGLVRRHRDELDRRQVLVELTPDGEALLHKLTVHHRAELRAAAPALRRALAALDGAAEATT